jgi:spore germination protein YaaH
MKLIRLLILIVSVSVLGIAQTPISIHQSEQEKYRALSKQPSLFDHSGKDIIPLQKQTIKELSSVVFGYFPYWMYGNNRQYLQYNLLSHLAMFDFEVSAGGAISYPSYWPWKDMINKAHENGVRVIMTVTNFKKDSIRIILTDSTVKATFFKNVKNILLTYKLDGVNIDFEALYKEDRGSLLNGFMQDLTTFIHLHVIGAEVSFAGPAVNWGGWDLWNLAQSCDYIFIMGYAFSGSWSSTSEPNAPLTGGSYNITNTVDVQYNQVTVLTPDKLILGVPYYGRRWQTENSSPYSTVIDYIGSLFFSSAMPESQTAGLLWDTKSNTPWYTYQESNKWFQVWFDTDESLSLKYDLADARGYRGVGMWALGYDGSRPELWNELRRRYLVDVEDIKNSDPSGPHEFKLAQNYPNPFNPVTMINYQLPMTNVVELSIYNLLGQKVATLVSERKNAGFHQMEWHAGQMASGVYYYMIKAGEFQDVKKMVLLR